MQWITFSRAQAVYFLESERTRSGSGPLPHPDSSVHLDSGSGEEEPVCRVGRVQVVLQQRGFVGSVDQQHVVQPPAGLVALGALRSVLGPAETHTVGLGAVRQRQQVHHGAAVGRRSAEGQRSAVAEGVACVI